MTGYSLSPGQARDLVGRPTLVTAFSRADGSPYTTGRVIGYSVVPEVILEAADGSRTHWRHDLCRLAYADEPVSESGNSYTRAAYRELEAEVRQLRELARIGVELDNHHNAATCPYCTSKPTPVTPLDA